MKKILLALPAFLIMGLVACNDGGKKPGEAADILKARADSLHDEVVKGHDVAMPKSMKIPDLQKQTKRLIDSIGKLPAKAREAAAPYKAKLEGLLKDLDDAYSAMDKWMVELNLDSAKNNVEQRIKYLSEEKLRVDKVKEAVFSSLSKADSLFKAKF